MWFREQAGRNVSERRAGLEKRDVGADPARGWGRPPSWLTGERNDPSHGPTGVLATACLYTEIDATRETPDGGYGQREAREGQARPFGESDRFIVP